MDTNIYQIAISWWYSLPVIQNIIIYLYFTCLWKLAMQACAYLAAATMIQMYVCSIQVQP